MSSDANLSGPEARGAAGTLGGGHRSGFAAIFLGPQGIRAGWRLLIFVAIASVCGRALRSLLFLLIGPPQQSALTPGTLIMGEATILLAVILAALAMTRIEKRSLGDYGLPFQSAFGKLFWQGAAWGLAEITLLMLLISLLHGFSLGSLALHGTKLVRNGVFWAIAFLLVGFFEEFLFRGYPQFTLSTGIGFWPSAIVLSTAFGAIHLRNSGEAWVGGLMAGVFGLFACFTLRRTGDLWFAIGVHFSFDYGETFLYSVPNSGITATGHLVSSSLHGSRWLTGGSVGPEGSAMAFVMLALVFWLFHRIYPPKVGHEPGKG